MNGKKGLAGRFCRKPFEHFEVLETGKVSVCCCTWLPYFAGELSEDTSVNEVFNSQTVKDIRESIHDGSFKYCDANLCPHIQNNSLPLKDDIQGPRMRKIVSERLVDDLKPDFYNLCYDESCNLSCPSCRSNKILHTSGPLYENRKKMQAQIIEDLFITPHDRNCTVNITGSGDPFGSKLYREMLFNIDGKIFPRLNINLQTNGVMFTPRYWDKMHKIHSNINSVIISIDAGTEETYNAVRCGGDWSQLHKNIKFISQLRVDNHINSLRLDSVIQADNYKEMPLIVSIGKRYAFDSIYFSRVNNWGTWSDAEFKERAVWSESHPNFKDFLKVLNGITIDSKIDLGNLSDFLGC